MLGNQRRPDESCAAEPAAADQSARDVRNARGGGANSSDIPESTEVRGDPQRIVALSGDQLDALCALGLQSRIVAAALPDGSSEQPSYLGSRRARGRPGRFPDGARPRGHQGRPTPN